MVFYIWAKSKVIENLFSYISEYSGYSDFLPFVLFLLFIRKLYAEIPLWTIFVYSCFCLFVDFAVEFFGLRGPILGYVNSSFTFVEYLCFAIFIFLNIRKKTVKKIFAAVSVGFIVFLALYFLYSTKKTRIDSIPIGIETLLILIFSFYLLFEIMNTVKDSFINYNYKFWVLIGMMIYLSGSFFIYLYANELAAGEGAKFDILLSFFYILKNIFFAIAIYMCYRQPKPKLPPSSIPFLDLDAR